MIFFITYVKITCEKRKIMKPIIGIISTPYLDKDNDKNFIVNYDIYNWILKSGGTPIAILPSNIDDVFRKKNRHLNELNDSELNELIRILDMCDGIVKPGGVAIYPYHKVIYNYAVARNVPYLGICAGMQLMVKAYDNNNKLKNIPVNHQINNLNEHYIWIYSDSLLEKILQKRTTCVNTRHKYCVHDLTKFKITATTNDGVIEAIENPICDYHLGLQWHPEIYDFNHDDSTKIFDSFIDKCTDHSKQKVFKKTIY